MNLNFKNWLEISEATTVPVQPATNENPPAGAAVGPAGTPIGAADANLGPAGTPVGGAGGGSGKGPGGFGGAAKRPSDTPSGSNQYKMKKNVYGFQDAKAAIDKSFKNPDSWSKPYAGSGGAFGIPPSIAKGPGR